VSVTADVNVRAEERSDVIASRRPPSAHLEPRRARLSLGDAALPASPRPRTAPARAPAQARPSGGPTPRSYPTCRWISPHQVMGVTAARCPGISCCPITRFLVEADGWRLGQPGAGMAITSRRSIRSTASLRKPEPSASPAVSEPGGYVQQPVAQCPGFSRGEVVARLSAAVDRHVH
jgi:hypothetical protein